MSPLVSSCERVKTHTGESYGGASANFTASSDKAAIDHNCTHEQTPTSYSSFASCDSAGTAGLETNPPDETSPIFPLNLSVLCGPLQELVPVTWRKIQSWSHLVLIIGTVASMAMLIENNVYIFVVGCRTRFCHGAILPLIFVACCLCYFAKCIGQYDGDLRAKRKVLKDQEKSYHQEFQRHITEMDNLVSKAMDAEAMLAERSFDAKRRDFQRFLLKSLPHLERGSTPAHQHHFLQNFRDFVLLWLAIFAECSIDPISKPLRIVTEIEVRSCDSVDAVASLVGEKLQRTEVQFITTQREKAREQLTATQRTWKTLTSVHKKVLELKKNVVDVDGAGSGAKDPEAQCLTLHSGAPALPEKRGHGHRWAQICYAGFGVKNGGADEKELYPVEFRLGFIIIVLLSAEHLQLICGFLIGFIIFYIEAVAAENGSNGMCVEVVVCMLCIAFVLYEFINIDLVQQLEGHVRHLKQQQLAIEERHRNVVEFYEAIQHLIDLWLHRTVPRLELMKHFHEGLKDAPSEEIVAVVSDMTANVHLLDQKLPALALWSTEEQLSAEVKKCIGDAMMELTKKNDVSETLRAMPVLIRSLEAQAHRLGPVHGRNCM